MSTAVPPNVSCPRSLSFEFWLQVTPGSPLDSNTACSSVPGWRGAQFVESRIRGLKPRTCEEGPLQCRPHRSIFCGVARSPFHLVVPGGAAGGHLLKVQTHAPLQAMPPHVGPAPGRCEFPSGGRCGTSRAGDTPGSFDLRHSSESFVRGGGAASLLSLLLMA